MRFFNQYRVQSIMDAATLHVDIKNVGPFSLSVLDIQKLPILEPFPVNLRLGHVVEKIVSSFVKSSINYEITYENLQVIENKRTLGEIDLIIFDKFKKQYIHLEVAYKFYLLDTSISSNQDYCWIGPNRKDTLKEKTIKLCEKQFPILYHQATGGILGNIDVQKIEQLICFMANLYLPFDGKTKIDKKFQGAVRGYYLNYNAFLKTEPLNNQYYIPKKIQWGIDPKYNNSWFSFKTVQVVIEKSIADQQSTLIWIKTKTGFEEQFIVWW